MEEIEVHKERIPNLSLADRKGIYLYLEGRKKNGELPWGAMRDCARFFPVAPRQVGRVYHNIDEKVKHWKIDHDGEQYPDKLFEDAQQKNGRPKKWDPLDIQQRTRGVPLSDRMNVEVLSEQIGVPKSSLHRLLQRGTLYKHTACLKPKLTAANIAWRYGHARSKVVGYEHGMRRMRISDMMDEIHIDEKWFYLLKENQRYILAPGEKLPHLTVQSKNKLPKVMFLSAIARPRYLPHEKKWFDGKIGMWPIGYYEPAKRASKNRPAGTLEFKSVIVDRDEYRTLLTTEVFPAILKKWPRNVWEGNPIYIQQDGAPAHLKAEEIGVFGPKNIVNDKEWLEELKELGLQDRIFLVTQPSNSPDLNVNDLGFFNSIQSEYWRRNPRNNTELVKMVLETFDGYKHQKLERLWLSYMGVINKVLEHKGNNNYVMGHMNKTKMKRDNGGRFPTTIAAYQDPLLPNQAGDL